MKTLIFIVVLASSALWQPARGQGFFDPDTCVTCADSREHFTGGVALQATSRLVFKKSGQRYAFTGFTAVVLELGQWDAHRGDGKNGTRGFGFGTKDIAVAMGGAILSELLWNLGKRILK